MKIQIGVMGGLITKPELVPASRMPRSWVRTKPVIYDSPPQPYTTTPHLYAVHGEAPSAAALAAMARGAFVWKADVAYRGTTVTL